MNLDKAASGGLKNKFQYWAFISYSHFDKEVALELARRLSRYKIPGQYRSKVVGSPSTFFPIFLDTYHAGANSSINAEVARGIKRSVKLLVVCSPFAASSPYVEDEIIALKRERREKDILCAISMGVPNAIDAGRPNLECFPNALRQTTDARGRRRDIPIQDRPLAIGLGKKTEADWRHAITCIAAGLLDISVEQLERARRAESHASILKKLSLALAATLMAMIAGWAFLIPHTSYSKDFARQWGVWREVDVLSKSEAGKRDSSYRFTRRGYFGPVIKVESIDNLGKCKAGALSSITEDDFSFTCSSAKACAAVFTYDGTFSNTLNSEQIVDQYGHPIETLSYSLVRSENSDSHEGDGHKRTSDAIFQEATLGCSRTTSGIKHIQFEREVNGPNAGMDKKRRFMDAGQNPRANQSYVYGWEYKRDEKGRILEKSSLDAKGVPAAGKFNYVSEKLTYTETGDVSTIVFYLADGEPALGPMGISKQISDYDQYGNATHVRYLGTDGRASFNSEGVYAISKNRSADGTRIRVTAINDNDRPDLFVNGYSAIESVYDREEKFASLSYFDTSGKPTSSNETGCFIDVLTFDEHGANISHTCLDATRRPMPSNLGVPVQTNKYDGRGNMTDEFFLSADGQTGIFCLDLRADTSMAIACPIHHLENHFDQKNNLTAVHFLDETHRPMRNMQGIYGWRGTYDDRNLKTETTFLGVNDEQPIDKTGMYGASTEYDAFGRPVFEKQLRLAGTVAPGQFVADRIRYSSAGKIQELRLTDANGNPAVNENGIAGWNSEYDARGREIKRTFVGLDNNPGVNSSGAGGWTAKYDRWGRKIEITDYYPISGREKDAGRAVTVRYGRDEHGFVTKTSFFDKDGVPTTGTSGVSGWFDVVSNYGQVTERRYFGVNGQPTVNNAGISGFSNRYASNGLLSEAVNLDLNRRPVAPKNSSIAIIKYEHDRRGNASAASFYSASEKPQPNGDGIFRIEREYDSMDRIVVERNKGVDGRLIEDSGSSAITRLSYDAKGRLIESTSYDALNRPVARDAPRVRYEYDSHGRVVRKKFYDVYDRPAAAAISGRAETRSRYDAQGRNIEESSYDINENPVNRRDVHWFREVTEYSDEPGKAPSVKCYTTSNATIEPCVNN